MGGRWLGDVDWERGGLEEKDTFSMTSSAFPSFTISGLRRATVTSLGSILAETSKRQNDNRP